MSQNTKPVCSRCGSADVRADAYASWSDEKQEWELVSTFDNSDCQDCGGECSLEWVPSIQPAVSEWERLARSKGWEYGCASMVRNGKEVYSWAAACGEDNLTQDDFLDDDGGQDRESYSDTQDRESYSA